MSTTIRVCTADDALLLGELVYALIQELYPDHQADVQSYQASARKALAHPYYHAYLIYHNDDVAGMVAINECCATYADGAFGEIPEFYIKPRFRSRNYGELLIAHVKQEGIQRGWNRIEVGAPPYPLWARTLAFYKNNGFVEIGPRLNLDLSSH